MIIFEEHEHTGYALRTRDNATLSDATISFAIDFKSAGEILTYKCCYGAGKPFIKVDLNLYTVMPDSEAWLIAEQLRKHKVKLSNLPLWRGRC